MKRLVKTKLVGVFVFFFISTISTINAQIITETINQTIIGSGSITLDLSSDGNNDYTFEIIELSADVFAARVVTVGGSKFLDTSTYGYPESLNNGDPINGYFNSGNGVLGTFNDAGQFNGAGNKFLGLKINSNSNNYIGWIELNCSINNDTLTLLSYGYNTTADETINAGQTVITDINNEVSKSDNKLNIHPNPCNDILFVGGIDINNNTKYSIYNVLGKLITKGIVTKTIDVSDMPNGIYILDIETSEFSEQRKIIIQ